MRVRVVRESESDTDRQNVSEILGGEVENRVYGILASLPKTMTDHDLFKFTDACNEIDKIVQDSFDQASELNIRDSFIWRRLLMPFHRFAGKWEPIRCKDFTWEAFFQDVLDEGYTEAELYRDEETQGINFTDGNGRAEFAIALVRED